MTLGERLSSYVTALGQKQEAIAADWLERYKLKNPNKQEKEKKLVTVISHLSRCLNDSPEGVKFFFGHGPLPTDCLFELLGVPQDQHEELRRLARECLDKEGAVTCRLVIDATSWGHPCRTAWTAQTCF